MGLRGARGVQERSDAGIGWADEAGDRRPLGGELLPLAQEVEEKAVEGTGGWAIADGGVVGVHLHTHAGVEGGAGADDRVASLPRANPLQFPGYLVEAGRR